MRANVIALAALLACTSCRHRRGGAAQRAWRWENPTPLGSQLNAACVDDAGHAFAVGDDGALLAREPGGAWQVLPRRTHETLYAVACGATEVVAVGARGVVLRSRDHGRGWSLSASGVREDLHAVALDGDTALIVGARGTILRGSRGRSFVSIRSGDARMLGVWTRGADAVAVGSGGVILRSSDGGQRWSRVESGTERTLTSVWGSGVDDLYAVGAGGAVLVSGDAGARWTMLQRSGSDDLRAVRGRGRRDVFVVGASGVVMHSRDGVQFIREDSGAPGDLRGLAVRGDDVVAVGVRGSITTRGASGRWRLQPGGHRGTLHAVWRGDDGTACAVGQGGAILCRDAALGWIPMPSGVRANLAGVAGDGAGVLIAVGDYGTVLRSADRGRSWALLPTGEEGTLSPGDTSPTWAQLPTRQNRALSAAWLGADGHGLIVGRDGIVLRSEDHGATWRRVHHPIRDGLFGVWGLADGRAWACGVGGLILYSTDHGARWTSLPQPVRQDLFAVWSDGRETLAVGRAGTALRALDGSRFAALAPPAGTPLLSVTGRGDDRWVATLDGQLQRIRRGGARWARELTGSRDDFTAVYASRTGLTLVGYWGTVLSAR